MVALYQPKFDERHLGLRMRRFTHDDTKYRNTDFLQRDVMYTFLPKTNILRKN